MKKSENLLLYFAALIVMLFAYVVAVSRMPGDPGIPSVMAAGLAVCALAQAGSDLLEARKEKK